MIFAGLCSIITLFFPETYTPVLLVKRAKKLRKEDPEKNKDKYAALEKEETNFSAIAKRTLLRPWQMLFQEPILMLVAVYLSVVYGLLYALFEAFPIIWEEKRGFNPGESGLIFIGVGIGTTIGAVTNILLQRKYRVLVPKWHGSPPPEHRLTGAMVAGPFLVIGIFSVAWTGNYTAVPWYVPALCTIILGTSFSLIFISLLTYIVDGYMMYAASALASNTICRSAMGAGFPLFTSQMFHNLGVNWAGTLVGGIALILAPSPFLFYKYGAKIRQRSTWAPCIDLKIHDQVMREEQEEKERQDPTVKA